MKRLLLTPLVLFVSLAFGQSNEAEKSTKHNISIGMFDDRTGLSLIGYTYNVRQTDMDEYFIGGGTMILAYTGTVGWKHYYKKSKLSISSGVCGKYVEHLGGRGVMPTISLTLEYNLTNRIQVKLGGMGVMLLGETSDNFGALPFVGLNFRF